MMAPSGWPSRESWLVFMWLTTDAHVHGASRTLVSQAQSLGAAADALRAWVENTSPLVGQTGLYADLLKTALGHVAWEYVAWRLRQA
jgi:hypothetical protein